MSNNKELINKLKTDLYVEGSFYRKKLSELAENVRQRDIVLEICNILNSKDITKIKGNDVILNICISSYDPSNVYNDKLASRIVTIISLIYDYETKPIPKKRLDYVNEQKKLLKSELSKYNVYFNNLFNSLKRKCFIMEEEIDKCKSEVEQYRLIQNALKYNYQINYYQLNQLTEFMKKNNYSDIEMIKISEELRKHNSKVKGYDIKESTVEKMLNKKLTKFNITSEEEKKYKTRLKNIGVTSIFEELCRTNMGEDLDIAFELFIKKSDGYSKEELSYIYKVALNCMIDYISESIEIISNFDYYSDKEMRNLAILDYNENYYKFCRLYYFSKFELEKYPITETKEELIIEEEIEHPNTFIYAVNSNDVPYMLKDLSDIPNEYLDRVKDLFLGKLDGIISPKFDECFNGGNKALRKYAKLKDDQIRIMYRHMVGNVYLVLGAFVKKDTDDFTKYYSLAKRDSYSNGRVVVDDLEDEISVSNDHEKKILKYIDDNHSRAHR